MIMTTASYHHYDGVPEASTLNMVVRQTVVRQTCLSSGRKSLAAMMSLFSCLMTRSQSMPFWLACRARAHRRSRQAAFTTFARPTSSTSPSVCACSQLTQQLNPCIHSTYPACDPACDPPFTLPVAKPPWGEGVCSVTQQYGFDYSSTIAVIKAVHTWYYIP